MQRGDSRVRQGPAAVSTPAARASAALPARTTPAATAAPYPCQHRFQTVRRETEKRPKLGSNGRLLIAILIQCHRFEWRLISVVLRKVEPLVELVLLDDAAVQRGLLPLVLLEEPVYVVDLGRIFVAVDLLIKC